MKKKTIYNFAEMARKIEVAEQTLEEWVDGGIASPTVIANKSERYFDESDIAHLNQIKNLFDIGYSPADVTKIVKKIGLPRPGRSKVKSRKVRHYLTVGELAKKTGLNTRTIKYWEERGIIEPTTRSDGGFRLYDEHYVLFCNLIGDLQLFGYTLEEIKDVAIQFRTFHELSTDQIEGSDEAKIKKILKLEKKIEAVFARMEKMATGIDRWRKLLKEKNSEIVSLKKKYLKNQEKTAASKVKNAAVSKEKAKATT
jgi:DNA-binding transcriptional MerR regulator